MNKFIRHYWPARIEEIGQFSAVLRIEVKCPLRYWFGKFFSRDPDTIRWSNDL
ncbi:hypothetical protein LEP1GSC107_1038 [Leptospira interrogans serovar Grippotyphosa str. UI 12769]|uniref:Uncharacterized protein n=1 Tax=Leptospira interrogans serovar Hardjo str. Norma TaxID=1279460 RepID=A0A0M4N600_LEPIR|nr:hypothetical protein G436_0457 [Leptospira interrogans serovar Hardjo str. Norma]EJO78902.1 hypothetical protein LEP1GSC045_2472 [Leptospira interrogans serovar Pomona str. Kennewicki LC82-25]EKN97961.1 hypothetical protein LEP1GSC014_2971 [Leptospira interrogans serovar Pomona str. Pomona]EKO70619.1 hypothetical protein LEP1GSC069_3825 [Leptospira interrogans serovar Canicola str. Fiocruz LV133]EMF31216.1 hypothetical protein LEP1GSC201_4447 [Leptospira interrogans serovar Pomona str. Fox 3